MFIRRLHFSKIYPYVSPTCDKCKPDDGTLGQLLCSCPKRMDFLHKMFQCTVMLMADIRHLIAIW